jgi:RNAse (barnase) inhibitor barstar
MDIASHDTLPPFPQGVFIAKIDGSKTRTLRSFYPKIAKHLFFPDYFGHNLDALFDCLCSLEVVGSQDIILLIDPIDQFLNREKPEKREAALQVLQEAELSGNRSDGARFRVIGIKNTD